MGSLSNLLINNEAIEMMKVSEWYQDGAYHGMGGYGIGLFGDIGSGATIRNVNVKNINIDINTTDDFSVSCGSIVGIIEANSTHVNIDRCVVSGSCNLTLSNNVSNIIDGHLGGIVGSASSARDSYIINCEYSGKLYINAYGAHCGGIGGYINLADVKACINRADINCLDKIWNGYARAGGILGAGAYGSVVECINYGNIVCGNETEMANVQAGGITGIGAYISDCTNYGNIKAIGERSGEAGGICGYQGDTDLYIKNCTNYCTEIISSTNTGRICGKTIGILEENYSISTTLVNGVVPIDEIGLDKKNGLSIVDGVLPGEVDYSEKKPTIWFTFGTDKDIEYDTALGYNCKSFNMDIAVLWMIPLDNSDPTYENVIVTVELSEGLSFAAEADERSTQINLGTMASDETSRRKDMFFTVYINEEYIPEEFEVCIKVTADGYDEPQSNTYTIPVSIMMKEPDDSIINTVERYTSGEEIQEVLDILNRSVSDEERRQRLFEYFNYDNMLDVRERIVELENMHDERWDYEGLINDEMYLSWQYYDYLNNTPKGALARAALYGSGLVFNGEINDWIDPATYMDSDLPGIKKYKSMLEEFIQLQSSSIEVYSYMKETEKFVNSTVGIWSETEKADFIKKMKKAPDIAACKSAFNDFVAVKLPSEDKPIIIAGNKPVFIEAMGITNDIFSILNTTLDGITGLVDVSSNIDTYEVYHRFLKDVYEADDLPWELKAAAEQLDYEMEQAYWVPIKGILDEVRDKCFDEAFDAAGLGDLLNKNGWLSAVNWTAFCINQFVDVGDMVVNSCHTEGYAFLAMHYKNKLEQCKRKFISNKTEENAWAFYEAYVMLWKLRIAGEKKFLQMSNLEGGTVVDGLSEAVSGGTIAAMISELCGYSDKEAAINDNLQMLQSFSFQYSIKNEELPEEYRYLQKVIIECPVSVEIETITGEQVCILNDKTETEAANDYGVFTSFYRATTGDYVKIAYFNADEPYVIKAIGQEIGSVSYSLTKTENHQTYSVNGFDKVMISPDDVVEIITNEGIYEIDEQGDGTVDVQGQCADKSKIYVQFDYQDGKQIKVVYADENGKVELPQTPVREGFVFQGWYSDPDDLESEFTGDTEVTASMTVYAKWEEKLKALPAPTADIESGLAVDKGTAVHLNCEEPDAEIYYTLDGTQPSKASLLYTDSIVIDEDIIIKAIAVKTGYIDSEAAEFTYTVNKGKGDQGGDSGDNDNENDKTVGDILPEDMPADGKVPNGIWVAGVRDADYAGSSIEQSFRLYDGNSLLVRNKDYTYTYKNNKSAYSYDDKDYEEFEANLKNTGKRIKVNTFNPAKAPQIVIKMKGNYSGSRMIYYKIKPADIAGEDFMCSDVAATYSGKKKTPTPILMWKNVLLKYGKDYYVEEYEQDKSDKNAFSEAGTYKLTVVGKNNFSGKRTITLKISESGNQIAMEDVKVKGIGSQSFSGKQIKPEGYTVTYKGSTLMEGTDYTVSFGENISAGKGLLLLTGTGLDSDGDGDSFIGTKIVTFKISGRPFSKVQVAGVEKSYVYTGDQIEPDGILTYMVNKNAEPLTLKEGVDYTVSYSDNMDKGTATIIFTGVESRGYTGTKKQTFKIKPQDMADSTGSSSERLQVSFKDNANVKGGIYNAPYMKGGARPEVIVTSGKRVLKVGTDYTVIYKNNRKISLSTDDKAPIVIVKGKGNYKGSITVNYAITAKPLTNENGITIAADDVIEGKAKNGYRQKFKVYDSDGKALDKKDYDMDSVSYTLIQPADVEGGTEKESVLDESSVVSVGDQIKITVEGKGNYAGGKATGIYRVLQAGHDINKAVIKVEKQTYTGKEVKITSQEQFISGKVYIKLNGEIKQLVLGRDIEVVENSYVNNVNKGTAKVTFKGINGFGGSKTVSFKIGVKDISSFWQGIYNKVFNLFAYDLKVGFYGLIILG